MSDRTTVPVTKDRREETSEVKDEYGETWNDVLAFYLHFRDEFPEKPRFCEDVYVGDIPEQGDVCNGDIDSDAIMRKLEQIESAQANTVGDSLEIADGSLSELRQEVRKLQELIEKVPEQTAETMERKYR